MTTTLAYRKELSTPLLTSLVRWIVVQNGAVSGPPIDQPLASDDWTELLRFIVRERVVGLLVRAIDSGLPVNDDQAVAAADLHRAAIFNDLSIERTMSQVADLLAQTGIEWRVLKGLATSTVLYRDRGIRSTGDVDILVRPADYARVLQLIRTGDLAAHEFLAHGVATEAHERSRTFRTADGIEVDVHRYVTGPLHRHAIPEHDLFADPIVIDSIAGGLCPPAPVLVLHAMLHLSTGTPGPVSLSRLSTLQDLVQARTAMGEAYAAALELAGTTGCSTPAGWADLVVRDWCGGPADGTPSRRGTAIGLYDRMVRTPGAASVGARLSGKRRLRRLWEAARPSDEFLASRSMVRSDQMKHIRARLRRPRQGPRTNDGN